MEQAFPLTRGAVHLARLDPAKGAEVGKCRPVVLLTAQHLLDVDPPVLFICPLSSRSDPAFAAIHVSLPPRHQLRRQSYALVEHCRAISGRRVLSEQIAILTDAELEAILGRLEQMLGR